MGEDSINYINDKSAQKLIELSASEIKKRPKMDSEGKELIISSIVKSPFRFGIDEDGNYGYYKDGADTVTPFKSGGSSLKKIMDHEKISDTKYLYPSCTEDVNNYEFLIFEVDVVGKGLYRTGLMKSHYQNGTRFYIECHNGERSLSVNIPEKTITYLNYGGAWYTIYLTIYAVEELNS